MVDRRRLAYESLKSRLVRGEFAAGERLREEPLAAEIGVSRTPVREALAGGELTLDQTGLQRLVGELAPVHHRRIRVCIHNGHSAAPR